MPPRLCRHQYRIAERLPEPRHGAAHCVSRILSAAPHDVERPIRKLPESRLTFVVKANRRPSRFTTGISKALGQLVASRYPLYGTQSRDRESPPSAWTTEPVANTKSPPTRLRTIRETSSAPPHLRAGTRPSSISASEVAPAVLGVRMMLGRTSYTPTPCSASPIANRFTSTGSAASDKQRSRVRQTPSPR